MGYTSGRESQHFMIASDDVTGLPTFSSDQVIEQIPLGQMVFPFADLDASSRMRRQPIYGDDVIPTSALLVGMDDTGSARAGTMTTDRRLKVDASVSAGSGLAGSSYVMNGGLDSHGVLGNSQSFDFTGGIDQAGDISYNIRYLTGIQVSHCLANTTMADGATSYWTLLATKEKNFSQTDVAIYLYQFQWSNFSNANTYAQPNGNAVIMFNPAIDMFTSLGVTDGFYLRLAVSPTDSGSMYISFWGYQ